MKPKSRAIMESDLTAQGSFTGENLKVHDNGKYAALRDEDKAQKSESENEQLDDQLDLDEKSIEYEETGDGDKDNNPDVSQTGEELQKLDLAQSAAADSDLGRQELAKRGTDITEEEYEDVDDQDSTCDDDNPTDESNYQPAKTPSEVGLSEKKRKYDSRVKRHDTEASENAFEKNDSSNLNEDAKQLEGIGNPGDVKEDSDDNSSREITEPANTASSKSSLQTQEENSKHQPASENLAKSEVGLKIKNSNEETDQSSKRGAQLQQEAGPESRERSAMGFDRDTKGSGYGFSGDVEKEAKLGTDTNANVEDDGKTSKQESNPDINAKNDESDSSFEKRVEQQIQQKIDSIKEEIKREVEEEQRIHEIELNNARYDEMQSQIEEDEDEDTQSFDIPSERKSILKRSIIDRIRSPQIKDKRHVLRRVKRSDTTDAQQLRAIEGVETLDPDVFTKAQLRHESIRKRSAPIYGAADKDLPDTLCPLIKRSDNPRRIYLVNSEQKRSAIPRKREVRNTIIIPEQAHANIEDELPPGLSVDPTLLEDDPALAKNRFKRNPERLMRQRRASAILPEGKVAFLGYRPQDDDENDEGNEFDDDGFEDRTSNLQQEKSYDVPHVPIHNQYHGDEPRDENPANFLFSGIDHDRNDFLMRRKRAGIRDDEQPARLRGGGALSRRQTRARAKQMQAAEITSRKNVMDRDKRQAGNVVGGRKSDSMASLVESSQELSPRLATEYKEAFGGLQSDPSGALARFKRVKRDSIHGSLV